MARICASSISDNKYLYRTGINDTMKLNAEKAININLNNTDLKDIFDISESTIIPTISAPLPSTTHQPSNTVRRATQSDIKDFKNKKTTNIKKTKSTIDYNINVEKDEETNSGNKPTNIPKTQSEVNYNSATTGGVEEKTLVSRGNNYYYEQPINTSEPQKIGNDDDGTPVLGKQGCTCLIM